MFYESFELAFPLDRPHCGMPMANGNMGVLIWGCDKKLCLTVNRSDFWDHRFGECVEIGSDYRQMVRTFDLSDVTPTEQQFVCKNFAGTAYDMGWRSTRLPAGRFEFVTSDSIASIRLDYAKGMVRVVTANGQLLRLLIVNDDQQLCIIDPDQLIESVKAVPAWDIVGDLLEQVGFQPPIRHQSSQKVGWFQSCPDDHGLSALCVKTDEGYAISLKLQDDPNWDILSHDWQQVLADDTQKWRAFWETTPQIDLPEEPWLNEFYQFALYKFASATAPAGVACGLQGPWVEEYQKSPWSSDYHFNVNIQQIYTLALSIGAYDHMLPLFDMLESDSFMQTMRQNAENLLGIEDGLLLTHAVDDRGMQCGGIGVGSCLDFACGGWVAQLYWLYYQHTQDETFLRERALPFMRGVMRVYEAAMEEYDGRLSIPLSVSAEYGFIFPVKINGKLCRQIAGRDPSNQLMCAHMLADSLIAASRLLGQPPKREWLDIKERLPKYTTDDATGAEHIILWEGQDLDVCHRHHSHLASVYPFMNFSPDDFVENQIINNTIDHWILRGMGQWSEWCYPWAAIIQTRVGFSESPIQLLRLWRELFINEGMATVYLPRFHGLTVHRRADMDKPRQETEIMQLDGTMAGATAILEMLAHEQAGVIHLFRGIPESWQNASFENIRLPGGYRISATMKNGQLEHLRIEGVNTDHCKVNFRGSVFKETVDENCITVI